MRAGTGAGVTDKVEKPLEIVYLAVLDEQVRVVEVLNDDFVVVLGVDVHDDGLDGRLARDEGALGRGVRWGVMNGGKSG